MQQNGAFFGAEGVAGARLGQPDHGHDVAGGGHFEVLGVVGVHAQDAAHALALALRAVQHGLAGAQRAGIDPQIGQLAGVLVGDHLEGQRAKGRIIRGFELDDGFIHFGGGNNGRDFVRGRQQVHHAIQQVLHALVLEGRAAIDRHNLARDGRAAQDAPDFLGGEIAVGKKLFEQLVILLGTFFHEVGAPLAGLFQLVGGDGLHAELGAFRIVVINGLHGHEVNDAAEGVRPAERHHHRHGVAAELGLDFAHHAEEIRAHPVHFVDEGNFGHGVFFGLQPDLFGLGLHAAHGAEQRHRAIQHPQRPLHLHREVHVAGRVNQRDLVALPRQRGGRALDGDAALALLHHKVHGGRAIVHLAQAVGLAGKE